MCYINKVKVFKRSVHKEMYAASIQRLCLHTSCHNLRNVVMSHLHSHALSMVTGAYENAGRAHVDRRWEGLLGGTHSGL